MKQKLTEIQIVPIKPKDGLVGFASLVYDGRIYLGSIGIYTRPQGGYRLTYPMKGAINVFHPINKEAASEIENAVIKKFENVMNSYVGHSKNHTD